MVHLQIDGKTIEVPEGTTVLRAADKNGIEIPRLCDHPALKPFGSCRVCLVEVQGMRTLQPSCTLPVSENMVVKTSTPAVNEARKFVLGLLFSERNHFCPFCQQTGGDCELQNTALDHEMTHWPIAPSWKKFPVDASNPDILVDHNRCILCRRCVRACGDLVGMATLGFEERGSESMLMADLGSPLGLSSCISCGVCVQVCPTGTLTDRHSAYQGRDRTGECTDSICIECGIGCGTSLFTRDNRVVRVDGDWQNDVNGGVLCKAGRFTLLDEKRDRILQPMVRKGGSLVETSWEEALAAAAAGLKKAPVQAVASSRLSAEALFAFQQLSLGIGAQASSLADRDVSQVPPFLGEHTGANLPKDDANLTKQSVTNASWAETYTVHAGANRRALQTMGLDAASAKLDGSVLVALADDQATDGLLTALKSAGFVVAAASYQSSLTDRADVVLPVAIWSEQEGHFLNLTGHLQKTACVVTPADGIQSAEAVLVGLAKQCAVEIKGSWETALKVAA
jgi:NADH dehydrogenase/NADH:ubiquinone oxidoreductase subunit G